MLLLVERLLGSVRRLLGRLGGVIELLESIEVDLIDLQKAASARGLASTPMADPLVVRALSEARGARAFRAAMRAATVTVGAVRIALRPDGSATAWIDGRAVELSRRPTEVLGILTSQPTGADGLPSRLPFLALVAEMERRSKTKVTARALSQAIYRLKLELLDGGQPSGIVDSHRQLGVRLNLRRVNRSPEA